MFTLYCFPLFHYVICCGIFLFDRFPNYPHSRRCPQFFLTVSLTSLKPSAALCWIILFCSLNSYSQLPSVFPLLFPSHLSHQPVSYVFLVLFPLLFSHQPLPYIFPPQWLTAWPSCNGKSVIKQIIINVIISSVWIERLHAVGQKL